MKYVLFRTKFLIISRVFYNALMYYNFLIYFRQGRLEDFEQTLMNEYVDFTTSAPAFSGINIKIKQEPKNIFGKFLL